MSVAAISPQGFAARPTVEKKRDARLDLLRFLGILVIMIAHAEPPGWLFQLRNFGTPLLIIASALTTAVIYKRRKMQRVRYWTKRFTRLTIPAWLFLTAFFVFFFFWAKAFHRPYPFSRHEVVGSYLFGEGIGFVWIFRVYIILAAITPFALWYKNLRMAPAIYFGSLLLMYAGYEALWVYRDVVIPASISGVTGIIFYALPYSILFLYGLRMGEMPHRLLVMIGLMALAVSAGLSFYLYQSTGRFVPTQHFKYPPRLYYLSYSLFAVHFLYLACQRYGNILNTRVVEWLSANSLWIYLWHIMATYIWRFTLGQHEHGVIVAGVEACYLLGFGVVCTYFQGMAVTWWQARNRIPAFGLVLSYLK